MTEDDVLKALSQGQFLLTHHALERMMSRYVFEVDIRHIGNTCFHIELQEHGTWRVDGHDTYGEELTVIVAEEDGVLIVTVY